MQRWRAGSVKKQPGDGSFFHKTHSLLQSGFNTSRRALLSCACRLPGVDPAAMQSGSSPEPGGGGRSAEPPPGPCESPPAAGARWLPLAPVLLPSLGNAINTQRKLPSVHQRRRRGAMTQHTGRTCSPYLNHGLLFSTWKSLGFPLGLFPLLHHLKANKGGKDEIKLKTKNCQSTVIFLSFTCKWGFTSHRCQRKKKCDIVLRISAGRSFLW